MATVRITPDNLYKIRPSSLRLYQLDFVAWYVDRWGGKEEDLVWSNYPEYDNHDWDGTKDPLYQIVLNYTSGIWTATQAATGVGKTWIEALIAFHHLDVFRDARIITVGESAKGLERTLWDNEIRPKFPRLKQLLPSAYAYKIMKILGDQRDLNVAEEAVNWSLTGIGVRKRAGEASSGALQGIHGSRFLILLDELAKIDPSVVTAVVNTASDPEYNILMGFGNPDNQLDALYQFGDYPNVERIRMSALDHPNLVCNRRVIPGAATWESVNLRKAKNGHTGPLYLSRVRGISAENDRSTLLSRSTVKNAVNFNPDVDGVFLGVDVANSEQGDEAATVFLKGNSIDYVKSFVCPNANAIALNLHFSGEDLRKVLTRDRKGKMLDIPLPDYNLPTLGMDYKVFDENIGVDVIGVGTGTVNEFISLGRQVYAFVAGGKVIGDDDLIHLLEFDAEGRPMELIADKRTLAFYLTKRDFERGDLGFSSNVPLHIIDEISKEGSAYRLIKSKGTTSKYIRLESKVLMRKRLMGMKSPNKFDALAIANFMRHLAGYGNNTGASNYFSSDFIRKRK